VLIGFPQVFSLSNSGRIDKRIDTNVSFLQNEKADIVLVYFGYVGCNNICIPSLTEINTIYSKLEDKNNVSIYFVNLLNNVDSNMPQQLASAFNKDFKGIYLKDEELKKVTSLFDVVYTKSLLYDYELNHPGYLYLLEKDDSKNSYKQKYIYTTRPYAVDFIVKDINKLLKIKD
jgi:protein SCO1/2